MTPYARRYFNRIIAGLVIIGGAFGIYRIMLQTGSDSLYHLNLFAQFILVLMGVSLVIRPKWPERHPLIVLVAFVLVGAIAMFAAVRQGQETSKQNAETQRHADEANARLITTLERINAQAEEIKRVQDLNTNLQGKLLEQSGELINSSKRISELSRQGIAAVTGGDSFAYMDLSSQVIGPETMTPVFIVQGGFPVYELTARIVDLQKFDEIVAAKGNLSAADSYVELGNITPPTAILLPNDRLPVFTVPDSASQRDFRIFFNARNGHWIQDLHMQKVRNDWREAVRIFRGEAKRGSRERIVFTKIDTQLPRPIRWHY